MSRPNRIALYIGLNLLFAIALALGCAVGGHQNPRVLYLILLFGLCSSVVVDLDGLNGRYSLLAIFLGMYFVFFGLQDFSNVFYDAFTDPPDAALSTSEALILVGGLMAVLGYRVTLKLKDSTQKSSGTFDWPIPSIVMVGILMSICGLAATYYWYFIVVPDKTVESISGIARFGQLIVAALILAQMLQPVGTLLLAYAWRAKRRAYILAPLLCVIFAEVLLGFVVDIKGMALMGGVLVVLTIVFTEGRIPKAWVACIVIFIYGAFPIFQAYRTVVTGNVGRAEVLDSFGKTLDSVLAAKDRVNSGHDRAQTFFERASMKVPVEMVVRGTANGVPFQYGYTLTPILSAFLPRILADKESIPVGRLVNKAFHVSEQEETYISPSHLGDLYWNFGWPGVVLGMTAIGALCGFIARFNLAERKTVTRLLVVVVTVQQLIHGFEGSLADSYVVWLRSMAAVGLLHWVFARVRVDGLLYVNRQLADDPQPVASKMQGFPNLLT